jgi:predicted ATPase
MTRLKIRNVGPIQEVDFCLNKVNILMGPQSCGKSTIAKILSFGDWLDKKHALQG